MSAICYRCMTGTATVATSNYASQRSESARAVHPLRTSRGAGFESSQANRGQALQAGHQGTGAYTHTTYTHSHYIHTLTHIDIHTAWTVYSKQQWRCSWCDVCYLLVQTVDALRGMYLPSLSKYPFAARLGRVATDRARPCAVLCGLLDPSQRTVFLCCAV